MYVRKSNIHSINTPNVLLRKTLITLYFGIKKRFFKSDNKVGEQTTIAVSPNFKFVYIRNPKVANTNFCMAIKNIDESAYFLTLEKSEFVKKYSNYFCFSFVKNPWNRVYSAYHNKICFPQKIVMLGYFIGYKGLNYKMTFSKFVKFLFSDEGCDDYTDKHWVAQTEILSFLSKPLCDFVRRIENLDEGLKELESKVKVKLTLQKKEQSNYKGSKGYLMHYNEDLIEDVFLRYKDDCISYGYPISEEKAHMKIQKSLFSDELESLE